MVGRMKLVYPHFVKNMNISIVNFRFNQFWTIHMGLRPSFIIDILLKMANNTEIQGQKSTILNPFRWDKNDQNENLQ